MPCKALEFRLKDCTAINRIEDTDRSVIQKIVLFTGLSFFRNKTDTFYSNNVPELPCEMTY